MLNKFSTNSKGKILGLDFGKRRIGVSITDLDQKIVFPRETLNQPNSKSQIKTIKEIVDQENIQKIVLGLPITLKGEKGPAAQSVIKFGETLSQTINCPIVYQDERFSSQAADQYLSSQSQKGDRDAIAASLILETYLKNP